MVRLYNSLKKYYPDFSDTRCTKENIYYELYGSEVFEDKKFRERFSGMMKLAEEYLSYVYIKKRPLEFKRQEMYELAQRGLDFHFDKKDKEIRTILDNTKIKDIDYFLNEFIYFSDKSVFYEDRPLFGKRKSVLDEVAQEVDMFLKYFSSRMILYYTLMHNRKEIINYKFEYKFYDSVMKFIEDNRLTEFPFIKALYLRLKITENEDDDDLFYELKKLYKDSSEQLSQENRIRIGTILNNDALRRFTKGKEKFEKELFEIMKFQLENDMYADEHDQLSREQYFNFVSTSVSLGEIEWAEKFVENYTVKIDPNKRKDACSYVKGLLHYHKKEYDQAFKELSKIKGGDYVYHLRIKALHSRIYFELMDYEKVLLLIDSFKHYISSNSIIPKPISKRYTNFINVLHKLTKLKFNPDEYSILKLLEEIKNYSIDDITTNISIQHVFHF